MNVYKRNRVLFNTIIVCFMFAFTAIALLNSNTDVERMNKQVYRIVSYGDNSIIAELWTSDYWSAELATVTLGGTNYESKVGDFINRKLQFVDTDGNVLKTLPGQKGNVYTVTSINITENLWWLVQGPLTYDQGQGVASRPISNTNIKVGNFINDDGQKVDMFGNVI